MLAKIDAAWHAVADLLFPPRCSFCERFAGSHPVSQDPVSQDPVSRAPVSQEELGWAGPTLCNACRRDLLATSGYQACDRCAAPKLPAATCYFCGRRRYRFDESAAVGLYQGALRTAVIRSKQLRHEPLTRALATLLAELAAGRYGDRPPSLVTPMPTHWRRRWARGVHGAQVLASEVGCRLGVPSHTLLSCRRATRKQGTLFPGERFRNVRGAFGVDSRRRRAVPGADVLLVDDVMTTGATASEAARALKSAGAARVRVLVLARGVGAL